MQTKPLFWILLTGWFVAYLASLWGLFLLPPEGDGFARGLNRLATFAGWQIVAATLGLALWVTTRRHVSGVGLRWLGRIPLLMAVLLVAGVFALIGINRLTGPDSDLPQAAPVASRPAGD